MKSRARTLTCALSAVMVALAALPAAAQPAPPATEKARAKEAYDRAVEAHKRGDYQQAAREFAEADALAPSSIALQAALDAAIEADDPVLGGDLLDRSRRASVNGASVALLQTVEAAKKKFAGRAGRVGIVCPAGSTCLSTIDGTAMDSTRPTWVRTGGHLVVIVVDGNPQTKNVDVRADQLEAVVVSRSSSTMLPPSTAPGYSPSSDIGDAGLHSSSSAAERDRARHGRGAKLSPGVFWVGVGATGTAAVATVVLMSLASEARSDFVEAGCGRANEIGCTAFKDAGESSQTRANVSLAGTGVIAVATIVIGLAFTDWSSGRPVSKAGGLFIDASGVRF
ncbi:MAG: hypothetical protein JST00_13595 [Deltaproteobacteria bacterium]|nr:hypothetical protein [Deltaproteobacteria bacterium]